MMRASRGVRQDAHHQAVVVGAYCARHSAGHVNNAYPALWSIWFQPSVGVTGAFS